jgi:aminoglycoside phosphotransferase (APT) family kinase protein
MPEPVSEAQIKAMCQRAFGTGVEIAAIQALEGGTFNTTYLITLAGKPPVVLRIAPPRSAEAPWDEADLMRREQTILPYFAPIAHLIPQTIMADFTHQIVARDYRFQTYLEGERWEDIADELTPEETVSRWWQFGRILKQIHSVQGEAFGLPYPGPQSPSWSLVVIDRLERTQQALQGLGQNQSSVVDLRLILEMVRANTRILDEIRHPSLLHGDLWLFNILVRRGPDGPAMVGVLDPDRAWWGDPMADWTMFILRNNQTPEVQEAAPLFWKGYGPPDQQGVFYFRSLVYTAMHAGSVLLWASRHDDVETVDLARRTLSQMSYQITR